MSTITKNTNGSVDLIDNAGNKYNLANATVGIKADPDYTDTVLITNQYLPSGKISLARTAITAINGGTVPGTLSALITLLGESVFENAMLTNGGIVNTKKSPKTLTDMSVTSGTAASVQIVAANVAGTGVQIYNPSATATAWINTTGGTAAANAAGCFPLYAGGSYEDRVTNAVTALIVSGQPLTVKTY
jgi:hypothetical protein